MSNTPQPTEAEWRVHVDEQFDAVKEALRAIATRQDLILELLTPEKSDGPTLDELLARVVTLIADQRPILRRIDHTTGVSLDILEGREPRSRETPDEAGADGA
ncbi:hypothetical protein AA23498_2702 [Acetobacter nitrogenifigens DSM 23921 = NBRC 105050]|uniref:Uncharacterized protein n=1 Tax=Acetobacter nitrogenifigens DSM 23921 = NBRC 105050 TaxID=1120919 RepID=A0A511XF09_9PROT|nr:hypothetical protein [Acetobacter nitrogenifigens]GBQ96680.1 hypothetical protein AA23498_2702 [Acetobacter nitrogenifigens DSM 23921 = NBRC 105050]GEN61485.1 hypothetical protein ANI02nite_33690 [Acetobacter nitrogenifigens DSM 23921 = NBRC 105050]